MDPIIDTTGWQDALDQMEADLAAVLESAASNGAAVGAGPAGWQPPSNLGPIPVELRERARHLAGAQQDALRGLQTVVTSHRKHAAFIDTVPTRASSSRAVYLDTTG